MPPNCFRDSGQATALIQEYGLVPEYTNYFPTFTFTMEALCLNSNALFGPVYSPRILLPKILPAGDAVYGLFFDDSTGFVSKELFPDFCNYRRGSVDFLEQHENGYISDQYKEIYDALEERGSLYESELKAICHYGPGERTGFKDFMAILQKRTYVIITEMLYKRNSSGIMARNGMPKYALPETVFGKDYVTSAYCRDYRASRIRILAHLQQCFPDCPERTLERLLGV